ncbi:MAG: alpha-glucuronidase [Dysgonamonadaceae bacterium]|jgi:alpha-glucuronidase|nr:alpha-glucuronidase [Dysgonamonadaceae bacterium]
MKNTVLAALLLLCLTPVFAEDGSRLWLRLEENGYTKVTSNRKSPTVAIAFHELEKHWKGKAIDLQYKNAKHRDVPYIEGAYYIQDFGKNLTITASSDIGLLYGAYHLLRLQETGQTTEKLEVAESPQYRLRILNHWDNLDGSVERGYAGKSLWQWSDLPEKLSPRYTEYARANASVGINGTVLNNVNASPDILKSDYLQKVRALADVFRPYGIKVYLSVNFSSPKLIGGLPTSDPLNEEVIQWWNRKVAEIYALIPDFGGFLVKANSEGQPGPQDFGRTHADGANMLATALKPHGGIVMWRAFVYNPSGSDRAKQAYDEFVPLDGQFADNVIIQVKNGPVDFQPREPFSPLFGALNQTPIMPELQITQEYLGQSRHLVYLAPMWQEFFESDTYCEGKGSFINKITTSQRICAIAGVANTGTDVNWCGSDFAQANWYAFGRMAWNPRISSEQIAEEWLAQTFKTDEEFVRPMVKMMCSSWETCVNYMMPIGLHHLFAWGHHYGPEPWCEIPGARADWLPSYYHRADSIGLGFDRTTSGSNAVAQYYSPLREQLSDVKTCPPEYLLWFHHVPWDEPVYPPQTFSMLDETAVASGITLWELLCRKYEQGVKGVRDMQKIWDNFGYVIDENRFNRMQSVLRTQARDAVWWRDACLLYFQTFSKRPFYYEMERPIQDLENYENNLYKQQ